MMRKQYTTTFKARVVQELLKEEKTLAQIATEYEVHPTQLKNWRAIALEGLTAVPLICNSDQGSHFTSPQYLDWLKAANVQISMDGKGGQ